jgi:hypothetical protein
VRDAAEGDEVDEGQIGENLLVDFGGEGNHCWVERILRLNCICATRFRVMSVHLFVPSALSLSGETKPGDKIGRNIGLLRLFKTIPPTSVRWLRSAIGSRIWANPPLLVLVGM